jgi:hypothetical protein
MGVAHFESKRHYDVARLPRSLLAFLLAQYRASEPGWSDAVCSPLLRLLPATTDVKQARGQAGRGTRAPPDCTHSQAEKAAMCGRGAARRPGGVRSCLCIFDKEMLS